MIFPKPMFHTMRLMTTEEELKQALRQYVFSRLDSGYAGNPAPIKHACLSFLREVHANVKMCYFDPEAIHQLVREEFYDTLLIPMEYYDKSSVIDKLLPENWD